MTKQSPTAPNPVAEAQAHAQAHANMGHCPNCGYCPHCGRSNFRPFHPYQWPYQPWVNPWPWRPVTYGQQGVNNVATGKFSDQIQTINC